MPTLHRFTLPSLCFVACFFYSSWAQAIITKRQYFSYVVECLNNRPKLLTLLEAKILREQTPTTEIQNSSNEKNTLRNLASSLNGVAPRLAETLFTNYELLKKNAIISPAIKIVPPSDKDHLINLENCSLKPVASYLHSYDDFQDAPKKYTDQVLIDKNVWDQLDNHEQIAMLMDFATSREQFGDNLIASRIFTGYWFSQHFKKFTDAQMREFLNALEFPYFEYGKLNIDFKNYQLIDDRLILGRLYRDNPYLLNGQKLMLDDYVRFYAPEHIQALQTKYHSPPYRYELAQNVFINMAGSGGSQIEFFKDFSNEIKSADALESTIATNYKNHELFLRGPLKMSSPRKLEQVHVEKALLKIRGTSYKVARSIEVNGPYPAIIFYPEGNIKCAENFAPGQILDGKNFKKITTTHPTTLCFDEQGLALTPKTCFCD